MTEGQPLTLAWSEVPLIADRRYSVQFRREVPNDEQLVCLIRVAPTAPEADEQRCFSLPSGATPALVTLPPGMRLWARCATDLWAAPGQVVGHLAWQPA